MTDQDVSIWRLAQRAQQGRAQPTLLEEAAIQSHQALGGVERYHCLLQEQLRVIKSGLERTLGVALAAGPPLASWLIRRASWLLARFHKPRRLGITPYRHRCGHDHFINDVVEMSTQLWRRASWNRMLLHDASPLSAMRQDVEPRHRCASNEGVGAWRL